MSDYYLCSLWIDKLTTMVQILIPMTDETPLDKLADIEDKIFIAYDQRVSTLHTANLTTPAQHIEKGIVAPEETCTADATNPNTETSK